jgi:Ca2+-binding EF-hand superfamily protein
MGLDMFSRQKTALIAIALLVSLGLSTARVSLAQGPPRGSFGRGGPPRGSDRGSSRGGPPPAEILRHLDRNRNGTIEPHELQGRGGEHIKNIARDKKIDLSRPVRIDQLAKSLEGRKDERRSRDSKRSLATEDDYGRALPPGFGLDKDAEEAEPVLGFGNEAETYAVKIVDADHRTVEERFRRYDSDRDGYLSREELRRNRWDDDPMKYDRNRDGRLSKSEMAVRYAQRRLREEDRRRDEEKRRGGDSSRGSSRGGSSDSTRSGGDSSRSSRIVQYVFDRYDKNKNGRLDRDEWGSMRTNPADADTDRNNTITRDEYTRWTEKRYSGSSWGGWGSRRSESKTSDRSKRDSERRIYSYVAPHDRLPRGLEDWFIDADANLDGQVAMSEFASSFDEAVIKNFREFDLNNDGIITPQECLAADKDGAEYEGGSSRSSTPRRSSSRRSSSPRPTFTSRPQPKSATSPSQPAPTETPPKSSTPAPATAAPATTTKISPTHLAIYRKLFDKFDTNKDGALVEEEWSKMSRPPKDADGDGRITLGEFIRWSASGQ